MTHRIAAIMRATATILAVIAICASAASAQIGRTPPVTPVNRLPDAVAESFGDALARAQAERERLERERWEREAEAERNRVHSYYVTCRVSAIAVRAQEVMISCDEARDVMNSRTGRVYARDSIGSSGNVSVFVDAAANPPLAATAATIAATSFADRLRLNLKADTRAGEGPRMWLNELWLHRGEGCRPACPP